MDMVNQLPGFGKALKHIVARYSFVLVKRLGCPAGFLHGLAGYSIE